MKLSERYFMQYMYLLYKNEGKKTNKKKNNDSHIGDYLYLPFETVVRGNLKEINYIVRVMIMFK